MLYGFKTLMSWLLPALAVMAILGGPSQSAASAQLQSELKHRQQSEQAERAQPTQDLPDDTRPTESPTSPAESDQGESDKAPSKKEHAENSFGSFVVIKSAKPADGQIVKVTLEWAACQPFEAQKKPQLSGLFSQVVVHATPLHHPAYHAHAPPRPDC